MIQTRPRTSPVRGVIGSAVLAIALSVLFSLAVTPPSASAAHAAAAADGGFDAQGFPPAAEGEPGQPAGALDTDCEHSALPAHDGFQKAPACSDTNFGEVADASKNPSLLITGAPLVVASGQDFTITISTRNLVRNRFLGAAKGGYYAEGAILNDAGLTEGHAHLACRTLASTKTAPDPEPAPGFFQAIEDDKGGATPDTVSVTVKGRGADGKAAFASGSVVQCSAWAGDGSHRTPMMERANQTPAFDSVRVRVVGQRLAEVLDRLDRRGRDDQ